MFEIAWRVAKIVAIAVMLVAVGAIVLSLYDVVDLSQMGGSISGVWSYCQPILSTAFALVGLLYPSFFRPALPAFVSALIMFPAAIQAFTLIASLINNAVRED